MFLLAIPQELTLLTDVGVYYPIGPMFCGAELLIISEARPQPRRGGRWRVWLWRASADGHLASPLPFWDLGTRGGRRCRALGSCSVGFPGGSGGAVLASTL